MDRMIGVDLSHWNTITDYDAICKQYDFVILKFGGEEGSPGKLIIDPTFFERYEEFRKRGIYIGCYFFMSNKLEVIKNSPENMVEKIYDALNELYFNLPIFLDIENQDAALKDEITDYALQWCNCMNNYGFKTGIYASEISGFHDMLDYKKLEGVTKWVARYGRTPTMLDMYIWQFSSEWRSEGIEGKHDINFMLY